jgi:hypothetical protein
MHRFSKGVLMTENQSNSTAATPAAPVSNAQATAKASKPVTPAPAKKRQPAAKKPTPAKAQDAAKPVRKAAPQKASSPSKAPANKPVAKPVTKPVKPVVKAAQAPKAKAVKEKKVKVVRDSFTIPKAEFTQIADMKKRAMALGVDIKKSELIRAGLQALFALPDAGFKKALAAVPTLKTGRPSQA